MQSIVSIGIMFAATVLVASDAAQAPDAYLRGTIDLSAGEIERIDSGQFVVTTLNGRDGREVVTFGAVRIGRPPDAVLTYLGGVDALRQGASVEQLGVMQTPPRAEDLATFTLDPRTVSSLEHCRPGRCDVQLPRWAIARFQREVPWRTPGALAVVHRVARNLAFETLSAYLRGGHASLSPYEDKSPPTSPSVEYGRLLASAEFLPAPLAALRRSVDGFPHRDTPGVRHRFFWTVADFGLKPMFRLSHMAIASGPALDDPAGQLAGAVATVQLMSTHYFSSTLEWHFLVRDRDDPSACYLYYLARSWAPGLTGIRGRLSRFSARSRTRESIETYLGYTKRTLESAGTSR